MTAERMEQMAGGSERSEGQADSQQDDGRLLTDRNNMVHSLMGTMVLLMP